MPRPGPVYDDAMKILADDDLSALLSIVGVRGAAEPLTIELPGSTTRADLLAQTPTGIVHVEFMKDPTPDFDLRMVDYRLRLRRRDRDVALAQYVLVLQDVAVPASFVDAGSDRLDAAWTVIRLPELDAGPLLTGPTTAAVAALAAGTAPERAAALTAAVELIAACTDPDRRRLLLGVATTLASITLPAATIDSALKEAHMPVPVRDTPLGRLLLDEGRQEGRQEGIQAGERAAVVRLTRLMLRQRFGDDPRIDAVAATLADLPDDERLARLTDAADLGSLIG
jgi:predicted transposase YdaD